MALTLKQKLYNYFAIRHLNLMPPEVTARFDDYVKNKDFQGQMKQWVDKDLYGADNPDFGPATPPATNPYELTADEWGELYDSLQKTFQNMNENKDPSVGIKGPYLKATNDFITEFFGDDTKTFTTTTASATATATLDRLAEFLDPGATHASTQYTTLKTFFQSNEELKSVFSDGLNFDGLLQGLRDHKYNKDLKFREKVKRIIYYIRRNAPQAGEQAPSQQQWPTIGFTSHTTPDGFRVVDTITNPFLTDIQLDENDPENKDLAHQWFVLNNRATHINQLKADWPKIFDTLINKSKVRQDFIDASEDDLVKDQLLKAIEQTDYENKDSDNYVPEKYDDEKNWVQNLEDLKNDTYESYLRKFTNPSRGTRIFFSPWSQNIIKTFDKEKIKPTDGLAGIISKKDAILGRLEDSPTSKKHFKWFAEKMEFLSKKMPKAYEGALRNGSQMRALVAALINEAVEDNEIDKAYTALEILSVAKYGLSSSRTLDALRDATKEAKLFSDEKLSWNKNEGIQFVTKAVDATARAAIMGVGAAFTITRNAIQNHRTKFNNDISKNKKLNAAYKKKQDEIDNEHARLQASNAAHNVPGILADLNSTTRAIGGTSQYKTQIQINPANIQTIKETIDTAKSATPPQTNVTINGVTVTVADLESDVKLFDYANDLQEKDTNWDEKNVNPYRKLIAYWDMLESVSKTHSFTLGSITAKRKEFLANWNDKDENNTPAKKLRNAYLKGYGDIRTA